MGNDKKYEFKNAAFLKQIYETLTESGDGTSFLITALDSDDDNTPSSFLVLNGKTMEDDMNNISDTTILALAKMAFENGYELLDTYNLLSVSIHNALNQVYAEESFKGEAEFLDANNFEDYLAEKISEEDEDFHGDFFFENSPDDYMDDDFE